MTQSPPSQTAELAKAHAIADTKLMLGYLEQFDAACNVYQLRLDLARAGDDLREILMVRDDVEREFEAVCCDEDLP
jgi:hypothetical protein